MTSHTPDINKADPIAVSPHKAIVGPIAAYIAFVMELTLVPLLLPAIQAQFGLTIGALAWVFNSYGIAVAVGVLLGGWCGDTYNTRRIFALGVTCFATGSVLVVAANSFEALIIGRALQGFGGGIFSPLVPILLTRAAPHRPGKMLIFWGSIAGYVAALAPLFYGSLFARHGWNIAFLFIALTASVALLFLSGRRDDAPPARIARAPARFSDLLRSRDLWVTYVYVFCTYGAISYYLFRLPIWLSENAVFAASVGFAFSVLWLTFSGLSALLRNMVDKPHVRVIMLSAPIFILTGFPLSYYSDNLLLVVLSSGLVGAGLACSNAPSTQLILRFAPKGMSAISTSLDITFARLGGILTVTILSELQYAFVVPVISLSCFVAYLCALSTSNGHMCDT